MHLRAGKPDFDALPFTFAFGPCTSRVSCGCISPEQRQLNIKGVVQACLAIPDPGQHDLNAHAACAGNPEMALGFQVTKQGIQLVEPRIRRLETVRGRTFSAASALLFELMQLGVYLVPQLRDAGPAGLGMKVQLPPSPLASAEPWVRIPLLADF